MQVIYENDPFEEWVRVREGYIKDMQKREAQDRLDSWSAFVRKFARQQDLIYVEPMLKSSLNRRAVSTRKPVFYLLAAVLVLALLILA